MFSDVKWYDWLNGWVAAADDSKIAKGAVKNGFLISYFTILSYRSTIFGMGNNHGLLWLQLHNSY